MKDFFPNLLFLFVLSITLSACDEPPSPTTVTNESDIEILFGIGNEIPMARETPLFNEAPIKMISSWFSKPEDLEWMRNYVERNTMAELYKKGYAQELIIWLDNYTQYAISDEFQADLKELTRIFKGNGPDYGPLYVVLFTEYETYSDDPAYYLKLKDAFLQSIKTIKGVYPEAKVAIGIGGYGWSGVEHREFKDWEIQALKAGDFIAVQAHHHVSNMDLMITQIRDSFNQLSSFGKPIMMSHFRIWKNDEEPPAITEQAFQHFIDEMFTEESMAALAEDGLFAWNFFWGDFINQPGAAYQSIRNVVRTYGSEKTELSYYQN
ncbi:MAG TPA: hypothetical protein VFG39_03730 [Balneolaceae bacterium]|nr:hypothetical protein [Balneolaceae bacterium]